MGWENYFLMHTVYESLDVVCFLPGQQIEQYFIEHNATAPHIAFNGVGFAEQNLGGHIDRSS